MNFTHVHTDLKSTSILDNFLVNERLLGLVMDAGVLHLGDDLSRHSPIMLKLDMGAIRAKPNRRVEPKPRRPDWYKATQDHIAEYTEILDDKLNEIMFPESIFCTDTSCTDQQHQQDRDSHVLSVLTSMVESSYTAIPLTKRARARDTAPSIPGWKVHVEPFRQDALFWHSVWLSAGNPNHGQLHQLMCWSRNKYHFAIRKLKNNAETAKAQALLEASEENDIDLLAEMKKIKGCKS